MTDVAEVSVAEMGRMLKEAAFLDARPLCVFESRSIPPGSQPFGQIDRCLAKAAYLCALGETGSLHLGQDAKGGICPGGQFWTGLADMSEGLIHFISCGSPSFRGGAAEHLKRDPEMVKASLSRVGRIRPPKGYLCLGPCHDFREGMGEPRAILLFATAEQARNLLALHHFGTPEAFTSAGAPWGPSCASFMSYPAGLSPNCPDHMTVIGPVDPTGNSWLHPGTMSLGVPISVAKRMVSDLDGSFLKKRSSVAFPRH
jgi:hypothetical protein